MTIRLIILEIGLKSFELNVYMFLFPLALFYFGNMIFVYLLDILT